MKSPGSDSAGAYEAFMAGWSRKAAREFVRWLALPNNLDWLDVGCGTGALSSAILDLATPRSLCGVELSQEYIAHVRAALPDPRCRIVAADATELPESLGRFDVAVSGLALNLVDDPAAALRCMARAVGEGGRVAAYFWDFGDGMQLMRLFWDAAIALDAEAAPRDQAKRYPMCTKEGVESFFRGVLQQVETDAIVVTTRFDRFEDYWRPFLSGHGGVGEYVASLDPAARESLRRRLEATLPRTAEGMITLSARAWVVRGICRGPSEGMR